MWRVTWIRDHDFIAPVTKDKKAALPLFTDFETQEAARVMARKLRDEDFVACVSPTPAPKHRKRGKRNRD